MEFLELFPGLGFIQWHMSQQPVQEPQRHEVFKLKVGLHQGHRDPEDGGQQVGGMVYVGWVCETVLQGGIASGLWGKALLGTSLDSVQRGTSRWVGGPVHHTKLLGHREAPLVPAPLCGCGAAAGSPGVDVQLAGALPARRQFSAGAQIW